MTSDGRARRRQLNVEAVLDAADQLIREGIVLPSPEVVAQRAGVSVRSVYRYFPDREQLFLACATSRLADVDALLIAGRADPETRAERVARHVDYRMAVHDLLAAHTRSALLVARAAPAVAEAIRVRRVELRELVAEQFAPDLCHLDTRRRAEVVDSINVLCQFESIETLLAARGLTRDRARAVLVSGVAGLLEGAHGP